MDKAFKDLIDNIIEVYGDDTVVKSTKVEDHPVHLEKAFNNAKANNMHLNLEKTFLKWVEENF